PVLLSVFYSTHKYHAIWALFLVISLVGYSGNLIFSIFRTQAGYLIHILWTFLLRVNIWKIKMQMKIKIFIIIDLLDFCSDDKLIERITIKLMMS
ncbi:hypothetical protein ACJX0J_010700, partial [Zea mays]